MPDTSNSFIPRSRVRALHAIREPRKSLIERGFYNHSEQLGWVLKPNLNLGIVSHTGSETPQRYFSTNAEGFRTTPPFSKIAPLELY